MLHQLIQNFKEFLPIDIPIFGNILLTVAKKEINLVRDLGNIFKTSKQIVLKKNVQQVQE